MANADSKSIRIKVALALAFASSANGYLQPATAEDENECLKAIRQFEFSPIVSNDTPPQEPTPEQTEIYAFILLLRAEECLRGGDYEHLETRLPLRMDRWIQKRLNSLLADWEIRITDENLADMSKADQQHLASQPITKQHTAIAIKAINDALKMLHSATNLHAKWNMHYIASSLLRKAGDERGAQKCDKDLNQFIQSIERERPVDESLVEAVVSILTARAYALTPVKIPYQSPNSFFLGASDKELAVKSFDAANLEKSEALWKRCSSLTDNLLPNEHTRRMLHRNLAIWYQIVGKQEASEQQKQILFQLIRKNDDIFLYPSHGACGATVWWKDAPQGTKVVGCGMG